MEAGIDDAVPAAVDIPHYPSYETFERYHSKKQFLQKRQWATFRINDVMPSALNIAVAFDRTCLVVNEADESRKKKHGMVIA